jgi:hypothetical protein
MTGLFRTGSTASRSGNLARAVERGLASVLAMSTTVWLLLATRCPGGRFITVAKEGSNVRMGIYLGRGAARASPWKAV